MGRSNSAVAQIEAGELSGTLTLQRLWAAADALDCDVYQVVVPRRGTVEAPRRYRAEEVALALVEQKNIHMGLEGQAVGVSEQRVQVAELAETLLREDRERTAADRAQSRTSLSRP